MSFARLHKIVTYALASLGLLALSLGGELSIASLVVIGMLTIASWWIEAPRTDDPRWQRGWNVVLLFVLAAQIVRGLAGEALLPLALETTAALQVSRLANRRRAAEHQQIAILAFLHLCAATVLSTEIVYGVLFFGFVMLVPWMLALTHLRAEIEGHFAPPNVPPAERDAILQRVLASKRLVGASFLVGTAALAIPLFLVVAIVFAAFPRVGLGFLAFGESAGTHVAGFGSDVTLGDVGLLRDDPTVVMRITPPTAITDRGRGDLAIRLRGTSFDAYDGRRWSRTHTGGERLRRYGDEFLLTRMAEHREGTSWSIVLEHIDQPVVFLPPDTIAVDVPPRYSSGVDIGRDLTLYPGLDLRYEDPDALGLRYVAWTAPAAEMPIDHLGEDDLRRYLARPPSDERLRAIAHAWTAGASSDRERARLVMQHLAQPPFVYSRDMADPGSTPPLDYFLETSHSGHCEYYASAMAILLREVGVPTRNVTGFSGAHYNAYGRYWAVFSGDAHAWVEAYLPGEGWVTFDPTPPSDSLGASSLSAEMRALTDAMRARWQEWIIGYDLRSQRDLARSLGRWLGGSEASSTTQTAQDGARRERASPWRLFAITIAAILIAAAIDRAYRRLLRGRTTKPEREIVASAREIVAVYRALEREMTRLGHPRASNVTPLAHLRALDGSPIAEIAARITNRYVQARFGGGVIAPSEIRALRGEIDRLRAMATPTRAA